MHVGSVIVRACIIDECALAPDIVSAVTTLEPFAYFIPTEVHDMECRLGVLTLEVVIHEAGVNHCQRVGGEKVRQFLHASAVGCICYAYIVWAEGAIAVCQIAVFIILHHFHHEVCLA